MKTKKYFMISALALLACSCQDEEQGGVQPTPGQDVQFGATLEQSASRTIYGDEANDAFPINWVNGDEVVVFSPDCASNGGVGSATYKVNVGEENSGKQNYANSLDKTGDIGVRWGDNETGSFYSIYPASSLYTNVSSNCKTVTLTMPAQQDNTFERTSDGKIIAYPDMRACFMYAYTPDVPSGNIVNLKYKPLSTAIRFKLQGPLNNDNGPVTINYVRIYAPTSTDINGTYEFTDVTNGSGIPEPKSGLNYVTMNVADKNGSYLTLSAGESVELNAFLLTGKEITIDSDWYIEVAISDGTVFTKHIVADASATSEGMTLEPGMIHRLPDLPPLTPSGEWEPANWMRNIQRNVYLSEISIPGSWYSLDQDYQSDIRTIDGQYNLGVRAFHFDTRWIAERNGNTYTPTSLGVAGTADNYDTDNGRYLQENGKTFEVALGEVVANVKSDEYMVVMCTFAQGSVITGDWRKAISDACDKYPGKIVEASSVNENTVVGDVLGKVIVIVNTYTPGEVANSKCLFFNMSLLLSTDEFAKPYFEKPLLWYNITNSGITMYGTHAQATKDFDDKGEYDSDRQSYVPTIDERKTKLQNILTWSQNNYAKRDNYVHNCWIYMGLGGYAIPKSIFDIGGDDYYAVSTDANGLNTWMATKVEAMYTNESYYPIGIVLMNFVGFSYTSKNISLVQRILEMNSMYRKAYDPRRSPVDGAFIDGSTGSKTVQSAAPGYSSGMTDNQTDAIGWTRSR
ncbi:hypothetical protein [uncultured Bacteroides sp.]|uniref:hypothetical protein n=1 Tax=uncultured Bacteroides sp. TaxID=162156 RepID=UPI00280B686A|nr:hypothetical protein [uncultured Bacteroides sp.]